MADNMDRIETINSIPLCDKEARTRLDALETQLDNKAHKEHSHNEYALKTHTHDEYADEEHNHNEYASKDHDHNDYALKEHTHDEYVSKEELNNINNHTHNNMEVLNEITDVKINEWDAKSNFSGDYNDLINKPTIPSLEGLATISYVNECINDLNVDEKISESENILRNQILALQTRIDELESLLKPERIPCTSISILENEIYLDADSDTIIYALEYTVLPEDCTDEIIWASTDESVAEVSDKGLVTAISKGEATISATCGSYTDTCKAVIDGTIPCTQVIAGDIVIEGYGNRDAMDYVTVLPSNTTDTITLSIIDSDILYSESTGYVQGKKIGSTSYTATCGNKSDSGTITVASLSATGITCKESVTLSSASSVWTGVELIPSTSTDSVSYSVSGDSDLITVTRGSYAADTYYVSKAKGGYTGEATITFTSGNYSCKCVVTIE